MVCFVSRWLKVCACIHAFMCGYTGFPAHGASGRQSDNIKKEILTVIKQFVHFSVGTQTDRHKKRNNSDFFQSSFLNKKLLPQVNGVSVEGKTHSEVVAAIKAGGSETRLLVVDPDTDAFFKRCRVAPTSDHLTGERTHRQNDFTITNRQ